MRRASGPGTEADSDTGTGTGTGPTVLLTGAGGFIGSAVLAALRALPGLGGIRALTRSAAPAGTVRVAGDLADPATLRGAADGADVLVHLASLVGGPEDACTAVNVHGTRALLAEAGRAGVGRIVHLSTSAVYGTGPHRGIGVDEVAPAPVSAASRTRLTGERAALDAGAVVLRAPLVLGVGDRWVVPCLADLLRRVPARWDGGGALLSLVAVTDLARLVAALALAPEPLPVRAPGVHHAGHPRPVGIGTLLAALADHGVLPPAPADDWPWDRCTAELGRLPGMFGERQFELMARHHWYRSEDVWQLAAVDPGPGPLERLAAAAPWYRAHLAAQPPAAPAPVRPSTAPTGPVPQGFAKEMPKLRGDAAESARMRRSGA
ncbi:NAD-dependent epimerase/dehydratase family protein [Streptomyces sp. BE20]|uniref:NAD-dependent epimerase/dehydratase family protein n=1 Tax=Streptomyces sp. BE20 TaxID=3002525 RepID=UPI002E76BAF5|nr:NAD-dependent epimerase/dehydratase family protein [Streptomyces sp. BE20]MEE1827671.1 NAD-dependent epimerase/dehydratase family protein [Streptomyces sp. BE20]